MHKYYYTYRITLLLGSLAHHYYYGRHRTNKLDDGYCGSGKKLCDYYKKYGHIEGVTYKKEIIAFYNNEDELNRAEKELIGDKYDTDPLCLNLCVGGTWGELSEESCKKISKTLTGRHPNEETRKKISKGGMGNQNALGHKASEEARRHLSLSHMGLKNALGHKLTDESKALMRKAKLNKVCVNLNGEIKLIEKDSVQEWLDKGWSLGRGKYGIRWKKDPVTGERIYYKVEKNDETKQ